MFGRDGISLAAPIIVRANAPGEAPRARVYGGSLL